MDRKRVILFLVLVFVVVGGGLFAHDKGDLMLHIEPQIGLVIPNTVIKYRGVDLADYFDTDPGRLGFEWALRGTVHYYFVDFFGVNAGMGFGGHILTYNLLKDGDSFVNTLVGTYFNIPFGFRFSFSAFAFGAGLTANLPLASSSSFSEKIGGGKSNDTDDDYFEFNPYMSWYVDIGFDLSGIKDRKGGFGMMFRLGGSLSDKIGDSDKNKSSIEYTSLGVFSVSIVFSPAIELANLPIGGK